MSPKGAERVADSVHPDQTAPSAPVFKLVTKCSCFTCCESGQLRILRNCSIDSPLTLVRNLSEFITLKNENKHIFTSKFGKNKEATLKMHWKAENAIVILVKMLLLLILHVYDSMK